MPLWFIGEKDPAMNYKADDGSRPWFSYAPSLVTPPRIYPECISRTTHFFYEPGGDKLVAFAWFSTIWWPGCISTPTCPSVTNWSLLPQSGQRGIEDDLVMGVTLQWRRSSQPPSRG